MNTKKITLIVNQIFLLGALTFLITAIILIVRKDSTFAAYLAAGIFYIIIYYLIMRITKMYYEIKKDVVEAKDKKLLDKTVFIPKLMYLIMLIVVIAAIIYTIAFLVS